MSNYAYPKNEEKTLEQLWSDHSKWSQETFGNDSERGPLGPLKHLQREVQEAINDPGDVIEIIDCLLLVFDSARRAGLTYEKMIELAFHKLELNKARKWPKVIADEAVEHLK